MGDSWPEFQSCRGGFGKVPPGSIRQRPAGGGGPEEQMAGRGRRHLSTVAHRNWPGAAVIACFFAVDLYIPLYRFYPARD